MLRTTAKFLSVVLLSGLILSVAFGQGEKLRYQLAKGVTHQYRVTSDSKVKSQMQGQDIQQSLWSFYAISLTGQDVGKDGEIVCIVKIDSNLSKIDSPMMKDTNRVMKELNGKRSRLTISPIGKVLKTAVIDTVPPVPGMQMMGPISAADIARRLYMELPEKDVAVGGTWEQTRPDTSTMRGMKIISKPKTTFKVLGNEQNGGFDCVKISFEGTASVYGTGSQQGMEMVVDGTTKMKGTIYFATKEGMLVSVQQTTTSETNISGTGEQMFSATQSTTSTSKAILVK